MTKSTVRANWTGEFPNICYGKWELYVDGVDVSNKIPERLRHCPMYTFGTYRRWHFEANYREVWTDYKDGLDKISWVKKNSSWLSTITTNTAVWLDIYDAFQSCDWRHFSCGGCI